MRYYIDALKNYNKTEGRATRKEFWFFILFNTIFAFVVSVVDALLDTYPRIGTDYAEYSMEYGYFTIAYLLFAICPSICIQVRRLHDVGKSGRWWMLGYVPLLNFYIIYLYLKASESNINAYGAPVNLKRKYGVTTKGTPSNADPVKRKVCVECGEWVNYGGKFCSNCGKEIDYEKYAVCIFDTQSNVLRKEIRKIDTSKFPTDRYAVNETYYAIETLKEGKKVRTYYEKKKWGTQIENCL